MSQSAPGRREVAYRIFAAEFEDSELSYSESDEERAPNYVVTPTGARVNRLFAVGVLTEVEDINPEMVRGRVVDPTGAFVTYAGQYQPDALAFLERTNPPSFIALSGKARTYEPDDGDRIYTSVRPERISGIDAETRDRWIVTTADRTIERIGIVASAIESGLTGDTLETALIDAGVDERLAEGVTLALEYYETTPAYLNALRELSINAVRVVADEREEAGRLELSPNEGVGDVSTLSTLNLSVPETRSSTDATVEDAESTSGSVGKETEPEEQAADRTPSETAATGASAEGGDAADSTVVSRSDATQGTEITEEPPSESEIEPESEPVTTGEPEVISPSDGGEIDSDDPTEDHGEASISEADIESVEEELEDFDPGAFELDEEERREVEEEFGTEFSTAGDVESEGSDVETASAAEDTEDGLESPEEADLPADEPETTSGDTAASSPSTPETQDSTGSSDPLAGEELSAEDEAPTENATSTDAGSVDLLDAVMETMEELDDGEGADRTQLISTVSDENGVTSDAVEEAIQEALMSGRCYEPSDRTLKSI